MKMFINEDNGYVITNYPDNGTVAFIGNIPDDAVVRSVNTNGTYLEDYISSDAVYPRTVKDGDYRVIAVLKNAYGTKLYSEAEAGLITEFEVEVE